MTGREISFSDTTAIKAPHNLKSRLTVNNFITGMAAIMKSIRKTHKPTLFLISTRDPRVSSVIPSAAFPMPGIMETAFFAVSFFNPSSMGATMDCKIPIPDTTPTIVFKATLITFFIKSVKTDNFFSIHSAFPNVKII